MIVVGDTSVLIGLERLGLLHLLPVLFGEVHVPDAVWQEWSARPGMEQPSWVVRHPSPDPVPSVEWTESLDVGESEAIQLARRMAADLLLMDEAAGRLVARRLGMNVTGLVGVLLEAKRRGHLERMKPSVDRLRLSGFWLSEQVYREILRSAGE